MIKKYKIVADENMPSIGTLFFGIADIIYANGRDITKEMLSNADALLCRSITQVNASLLNNSSIQFVGTATIGIDHLDTHWLNAKKISWSNAAGCNAPAVGQYVLSAISYWSLKNNRSIQDLNVGIIGAGNVGTILAQYLDFYGIDYKLYDPPLQQQGDSRDFADFQSILKCDVVSLHVPITAEGEHATRYMFAIKTLEQLNSDQLLINASRGAVINNQDLDDYLTRDNAAQCVLDVFENEPNINPSLVQNTLLATPHIAGHTLEGKLRGSWMIYQAFCRHFAIETDKQESELYPASNELDLSGLSLEKRLLAIYDISLDSKSLKNLKKEEIKIEFDQLRTNATQLPNGVIRRDYSGWCIKDDCSNFLLPK
ncbi:MAG: erythronate-4-phosphate dehydrogenase [Gammaproteobacteria bacterium]|nr:MAG: erythronate-4-phosphate dehydrogenase [Gammaproteobacteria bacterium]